MGKEVTLADALAQVKALIAAAPDKAAAFAELQATLHDVHPCKDQPVARVRWVPIEKVHANDYNPNSVAKNEMKLLHTSISHDGYTQPVVTIYDPQEDKYVIVDGFHRYTTMRLYEDIRERCNGLLPVVVIEKDINDRMASTVRHNRARGKHSVSGMASMVFQMLENGWGDAAICEELGLEPDELIRLKHVTGFSKLFDDIEYKNAWETRSQIKLRVEAERTKHAVGSKAGDLDAQYEASKPPRAATDEEIATRQAEMEQHFKRLVDKAKANLAQVTCPGCGTDFMVEKDKVVGA